LKGRGGKGGREGIVLKKKFEKEKQGQPGKCGARHPSWGITQPREGSEEGLKKSF